MNLTLIILSTKNSETNESDNSNNMNDMHQEFKYNEEFQKFTYHIFL